MPPPQAALMKQAARAKFMSFNLKVPPNWQEPVGAAKEHYDAAFPESDKVTAPGSPPLFQPATFNKLHTDAQKELSQVYGALLDGMCDAICNAWSTWQRAATLVGVMINGPTASGGQVVGPPWMPLILAAAPKSPPMLKWVNAIATPIANAWLAYTATIKVAGMPWYPAFTAFPAPVAPPTPNIPCPVAALVQVPVSLSPQLLKTQMVGLLADPTAPHHRETFESIATAFDQVFQVWKTSTMVTNVLGTGPIPTFAPPYIPAGPVVAGVGTMTPGGFA